MSFRMMLRDIDGEDTCIDSGIHKRDIAEVWHDAQRAYPFGFIYVEEEESGHFGYDGWED